MLVGNAPVFISREDGSISGYRTGLNFEEMIDAFEEEKQIWALYLSENIYDDPVKVFALKETLKLSIPDCIALKSAPIGHPLAQGAHTRLNQLRDELKAKNIETFLKQKSGS